MKQAKIKKIDIGDGRLFILDDFISSSDCSDLSEFFDEVPFLRTESDSVETRHIKSWAYNFDNKTIKKLDLQAPMRDQIQKLFNIKKVKIFRSYCNSTSYGDLTFTHIDCTKAAAGITALLYVNDKWEKDWGGETLFFDEDNDAEFAVTPKPGRLILFDGHIKHRTGIPQRNCYQARRTFVIKYKVESKGRTT